MAKPTLDRIRRACISKPAELAGPNNARRQQYVGLGAQPCVVNQKGATRITPGCFSDPTIPIGNAPCPNVAVYVSQRWPLVLIPPVKNRVERHAPNPGGADTPRLFCMGATERRPFFKKRGQDWCRISGVPSTRHCPRVKCESSASKSPLLTRG